MLLRDFQGRAEKKGREPGHGADASRQLRSGVANKLPKSEIHKNHTPASMESEFHAIKLSFGIWVRDT